MEYFLFLVVLVFIAVSIGRYWQYKISEKKLNEKINIIELTNKNRQFNLESVA